MTQHSCVRGQGSTVSRWGLTMLMLVAALVLPGGVVDLAAQTTGPITAADFSYLGAFRFDCSGDWCAFNLDGLGVAADGSLWVTDHVYDYAVRRVEAPAMLLSSQVFGDLPEVSTLEGPLTTAGCPGTATELNGVTAIGTEAATTCRDYYNVGGDYLAVFRRRPAAAIEEIGPRLDPFHPNKFGAYLFGLPTDWATAQGLGTKTLVTGFSREAGAFGGSQGPTFFAFDPDNPSDASDLMWYREIYPGCPGTCDFPGYESVDSWMGADWVRSGAANAILVSGVKGGSTCYGSGPDCGDPCRPYQGYHGYPYTPQILFYNPDDLALRLVSSLSPWEVVPYEVWSPSEFWEQGCPNIGGLAFDETSGRLYVAERLAGPYDEGIVHVWELGVIGEIFTDGFESGDATAWSSSAGGT